MQLGMAAVSSHMPHTPELKGQVASVHPHLMRMSLDPGAKSSDGSAVVTLASAWPSCVITSFDGASLWRGQPNISGGQGPYRLVSRVRQSSFKRSELTLLSCDLAAYSSDGSAVINVSSHSQALCAASLFRVPV